MRFLKIVFWLILLLIASPVLYLASGTLYISVFRYTHHFRLVLEVEDHGEIRSGSSVISASISPRPPWIPSVFQSISIGTRGEAVVVELSTGRLAVATLNHGYLGNSDRLYSLAAEALGRSKPHFYTEAPWWQGSAELRPDLIPLIVTFDDINDPYSIRGVPPEAFPEVFGPDIRFRRMWLEMTSARVTRRIEEKIPFLVTRRRDLSKIATGRDLTPNISMFIRGR